MHFSTYLQSPIAVVLGCLCVSRRIFQSIPKRSRYISEWRDLVQTSQCYPGMRDRLWTAADLSAAAAAAAAAVWQHSLSARKQSPACRFSSVLVAVTSFVTCQRPTTDQDRLSFCDVYQSLQVLASETAARWYFFYVGNTHFVQSVSAAENPLKLKGCFCCSG